MATVLTDHRTLSAKKHTAAHPCVGRSETPGVLPVEPLISDRVTFGVTVPVLVAVRPEVGFPGRRCRGGEASELRMWH